ncbi:MAG: contractile injection system protein, VgrG/Pvc8 family [Desulfotomaculaceae bacterium]|nr:contractile injection system protein, VgrG/Pvc8 family [Desulfotomaculaceae bacterium]
MDFIDLEKKYRNFYAPAFEIKAAGQDLLQAGVEIADVTVDHTLAGADTFSFTVNNAYDAVRRELKWLDGLLAPGSGVAIKMGYTDKLAALLTGLITSVRATFPAGGLPALEVSGFDLSHQLMKGRQSTPWPPDTKDSDIAKKIAAKYSLSSVVEDTRVKYPEVNQDQESDFDFLTRLAQRNHFEFFVFGRTLYFRAPANDQAPVLSLAWGQTLVSFSPEINLGEQVSAVEIRGWDAGAKKEIVGRAKTGDEKGRDSSGSTGGEMVSSVYGQPVTERLRLPVGSQEEADSRARAILNQCADGLVRGSGESIGIPELLPGKNIKLERLGKKFSKTYYVERTNHSIGGAGYRTTFSVKENAI